MLFNRALLKRTAANCRCTKKECVEKLKSGEYSVVEVVGPSDAWKKFGRVVVTATKTRTDFVQCLCVECRHIKVSKVNSGNRKVSADHVCKPKGPQEEKPPLSRGVKSGTAALLAEMTGETFVPFNLCESKAFKKLVKYTIEIGDTHGANVDILEVLPTSKTVADKIKSNADAARGAMLSKAKPAIKDDMASGTVDGWTDPQRQRKYMAHTVSYIDEKWYLEDALLCLPHCNAESVTADVISAAVTLAKAEINIPATAKMHMTTDDGADVVAAMRLLEQERSYCMDHCSNLVVKKAMQAQLTRIDLFGEAGIIVDKVNAAIGAIKSSRAKNVKT